MAAGEAAVVGDGVCAHLWEDDGSTWCGCQAEGTGAMGQLGCDALSVGTLAGLPSS